MKKIYSILFKLNTSERGQALITLLFFMVIGISVISASVFVLSSGLLSATSAEQGFMAYYAAEGGAENGILYLLRNPSYSGSQLQLDVGSGHATVDINSGVITSTGTFGSAVRKVQIQTTYNNGMFSISSWQEIN